MKSTTVFRSAQIVSPQKKFIGDLVVENNKFKEISKIYTGHHDNEVDCTNLTILPGLIDTHVHFRDPGLTEKEDFDTGSQAAAAGGVTSFFEMPNTNPPSTSSEALKQKKEIAQAKSHVNYNLFAGLTDNNFEEINQCQNIAGIKIFFGSSTGNMLVNNLKYLKKVFQKTNHLLAFHAEDENIIQANTTKLKNNTDLNLHSKIRSREAEIEAIRSVLELAKENPQTRVHICHVSTKEAVGLFAEYNLQNVTAEVSMHHLLLNEEAYEKHGNFVKINPPLRTKKDNQALLKALKKGLIQTIATDHAPHLKTEKEEKYWQAPSGVPMVELTLPLLLDLANQGKINLSEIVKWTSFLPAKLFGIQNKGEIKAGQDADFTIVDLQQKHTINNDKLFTKCKWTPFDKKELTGKVIATYVNGKIVFVNEEIVNQSLGQEIKIQR